MMDWLLKPWVVLASLALNMFLIGTLVPTFFQPERPRLVLRHGMGPEPMDMLRHWTPGLSEADSRILCEAMRPGGEGFEELKQAMEESVRRSSEALRAEPFDPAAFKGALTPVVAARTRFEERQIDALAQAAARMSRDGRVTLMAGRFGAVRPGLGAGGPGGPGPMMMPPPGGPGFQPGPGPVRLPMPCP